MSRFAILGGAGFVGANLAARLAAAGNEVVVVDNLTYTQPPNGAYLRSLDRVDVAEGDICDELFIHNIIGSGFDGIFHLASVVGIKNYLTDAMSLIDVNIMGTRNVAKACLYHGVRMLFTSTSEVLGRNTNVPWREDADRVYGAPTVDRWAYGASKGVAEQLLNVMYRQHGLKMTIIRFFNVYGPFQRPYFVASKTLYHYLNGESPLKYDSGRQTRCFTYIEDAIDAVVALILSNRAIGETYHIGSEFEHTVDELIEITRRLCGSTLGPSPFDTSVKYGAVYEDIERRVPNVEKIRDHIGWRATTDLEAGMTKFRDWAVANQWWLELRDQATTSAMDALPDQALEPPHSRRK